MPAWLKVVAAVAAFALAMFLMLFIVARLAGYSSTMDMLRYLRDYLGYIWNERLFR